LGTLKETDKLAELRVDGTIILKCFLSKYDSEMWIRFMWLRIGSTGWLLKGGEFLAYLTDIHILKNDSAVQCVSCNFMPPWCILLL